MPETPLRLLCLGGYLRVVHVTVYSAASAETVTSTNQLELEPQPSPRPVPSIPTLPPLISPVVALRNCHEQSTGRRARSCSL